MRRALKLSAVVCLFALAMTVMPIAQESTILRGTVKDPSGAVLPGVAVTLSRADLADRSTITNERGEFVFKNVMAGLYEVTAELLGFETSRVVAVVSSDRVATLSLTMRVGSVTETVMVAGQTPTVDA